MPQQTWERPTTKTAYTYNRNVSRTMAFKNPSSAKESLSMSASDPAAPVASTNSLRSLSCTSRCNANISRARDMVVDVVSVPARSIRLNKDISNMPVMLRLGTYDICPSRSDSDRESPTPDIAFCLTAGHGPRVSNSVHPSRRYLRRKVMRSFPPP